MKFECYIIISARKVQQYRSGWSMLVRWITRKANQWGNVAADDEDYWWSITKHKVNEVKNRMKFDAKISEVKSSSIDYNRKLTSVDCQTKNWVFLLSRGFINMLSNFLNSKRKHNYECVRWVNSTDHVKNFINKQKLLDVTNERSRYSHPLWKNQSYSIGLQWQRQNNCKEKSEIEKSEPIA